MRRSAQQIMERAFDYLDAPVKRVSGIDVPMPYAKNLENLAIPDVDRLIAAVREVAYISISFQRTVLRFQVVTFSYKER